MSSPAKKPRVSLSIADKIQLINDSENGESNRALSQRYNVSTSFVQRLLRDKDRKKKRYTGFLKKFAANRQHVYGPKFQTIDDAVFLWLNQQLSLRTPLNGEIIREIANVFNEKLQPSSNFVASSGWLYRFQNRHKIKASTGQDENRSWNYEEAQTFPKEFRKRIEGVDPSNLYSADEGGLFWRAFPVSTLVGPEEEVSSIMKNQDRVTFLFCANSTGTHALPLLMIGKSKVPHCWRNIEDLTSLPVIYTNESNGWMTALTFFDWYRNVFIEEVKQRQKTDSITGKVVLLLDTAGCHPPKELIDTIENDFFVEYIPALCSSVHPLRHGVIATMKRSYRRALVRKLRIEQPGLDLKSFQKTLTLDDCALLSAQAWGKVHPFTLARAWRLLLGHEHADEDPGSAPSPDISILEEIRRVSPTILETEVDDWMLVDHKDRGHAIMTIDEIVESVREADDDESVEGDVGLESDLQISEDLNLWIKNEVIDQPTATSLLDEEGDVGVEADLHSSEELNLSIKTEVIEQPTATSLQDEEVGVGSDLHSSEDLNLRIKTEVIEQPTATSLQDEEVGVEADLHSSEELNLSIKTEVIEQPIATSLQDEEVGVGSDLHSSEDLNLRIKKEVIKKPTLQDAIAGLRTALSFFQNKRDARSIKYRRQLEEMLKCTERM